MNLKSVRTAAVFLIFALAFSGCATKPAQKNNSNSPDLETGSAREEALIGAHIHDQIMSSFYPYTEPKAVRYINQVGNDLAKHAGRRDLHYRFTILYNEKIYAASAPGGYVYLTTGLIYFLKTEAELAAVLAHEIAELQFRDPKLSRAKYVLDKVTKGGAMVAPAFGPFGMLAALGLVTVNGLNNKEPMPFDQRMLAADAKALGYMVEAGYDPQGMTDLLYQFLNAEKEVTPYFYDYYQARPITEARFHNIDKAFKKLPLEGKSLSTHYERYQEMTRGIREIYRT